MKKYYLLKIMGIILMFGSVNITGFSQDFIFTNCDATGQDGPTGPMITAEYVGTSLDGLVTGVDGIQYWTVPSAGEYSIEVFGAEGGDEGGLGARMYGEFVFAAGTELKILVGQMGGTTNSIHGSGGGGTFVVFADDDAPIIIAGGGGGHGASAPGISEECDGAITEAGQSPIGGGPGGTGGGGGAAASGATGGTEFTQGADATGSTWSSGGGGYFTKGGGMNSGGTPGGRSFLSGGRGGDASGGANYPGGFGCGGGAGDRGAGGGGYSGGGGATNNAQGGGGGGSYNDGINQDNTAGANSGHGLVYINRLCVPLTLVASETGVCADDIVNLLATSETGGVVTWDMDIDNGDDFVPPLGETIYTATSSNPDDCVLEVTVTSTEVPVLIPNSSSPAACEGTEITLWGEGGDTYLWDMGVEDGVPFEAMPGVVTYTLTGSLLGCEGDPVTITLTGAPRPDASSTATPSEICLGESYVLTGDGGSATYNWGRGINDGDELTPASAGSYTHIVVGNSDVGCGDTSMVTVIVHGLPVVNGGSDIAVCEGEEVTLTGSGTRTISWDMGITNGVPFTVLAGETVYTVTGTDIHGCEDTDEVLVTGVEIPRIVSTDITPEYFGYDGLINITVEGGSGEYTYLWSHGPSTEDASSLTDGTYTVVINDITLEQGLCPLEATFTIGTELGLEDVELVELNVYPNPTTDRLVIVTAGTFNYDVLSITGEVILQGQGTDQAELSMKELANGAYIIRVNANDKIGFAQVVKQ